MLTASHIEMAEDGGSQTDPCGLSIEPVRSETQALVDGARGVLAASPQAPARNYTTAAVCIAKHFCLSQLVVRGGRQDLPYFGSSMHGAYCTAFPHA